jgi:hypothetical protein
MYCPQCGIQVSSELKYCRQCGANLRGVQEAMTARNPGKGIDWSRTWVAEMFMSEEERERRQGITPEIKRLNEIKAGVITSCVGIGVTIFMYFLMTAIAAKDPRDADILLAVRWVGLVPFVVGLAILFNGLFVSKKIVELQKPRSPQRDFPETISASIESRTTNELTAKKPASISDFSITEQETLNLPEAMPAKSRREMQ